jgi:hypothetical protein
MAILSFLFCAGSLGYAVWEYFRISQPEYIPVLQGKDDLNKEYFQTTIQNADFVDYIVKSGLKQKLVTDYGQSPKTSYFYITAPGGAKFIAKSEVDLRGANSSIIFTTKLSRAVEQNKTEIAKQAKVDLKLENDVTIVEQVSFEDLQATWKTWGILGLVGLALTSFFTFGYRVESNKQEEHDELTYTLL